MAKSLIEEIEAKMSAFFANATDDEFWATLKSIDDRGFTKIDIPLTEIHELFAVDIEIGSLNWGASKIPVRPKDVAFIPVESLSESKSIDEFNWAAPGMAINTDLAWAA